VKIYLIFLNYDILVQLIIFVGDVYLFVAIRHSKIVPFLPVSYYVSYIYVM